MLSTLATGFVATMAPRLLGSCRRLIPVERLYAWRRRCKAMDPSALSRYQPLARVGAGRRAGLVIDKSIDRPPPAETGPRVAHRPLSGVGSRTNFR